jgi:hypothetical protein
MAVEETGMGVVEDRVVENHFASEYIYNKYKDERTCGIVETDDEHGILTFAEPVGIILRHRSHYQPDLHGHLQSADQSQDPCTADTAVPAEPTAKWM